ncbi:MAG: hypothetical protein OEV26_04425 [Gallionella sp.]|nr:hypothetical protein [Gallionella sp.]MDH4286650.1 hypothetical protein [Gallionella sp.]
MKTMEQNLVEWKTNDRDIGDDLHRYFEDEFGRWDWCEIYEEGIRIGNLMFEENVEKFSPRAGLLAAVAAQAARGAVAQIAACLGVERQALEHAIAEWSEDQDSLPPPISAEKLLVICAEQAECLHNLEVTNW